MNIEHLRYVIEIAKAGSISQAADNLFMGQPNLSKALKELEATLNISIFTRTSKGAELTDKGRQFVRYAQGILQQYEELEALGREDDLDIQSLSLSVPRISYIADAFTAFLGELNMVQPIGINYEETNALRTIDHVTDSYAGIGIVRCKTEYQNYFIKLFKDNGLSWRLVLTHKYRILLSAHSPLASQDQLQKEDLLPYIELIHGDTAIPYLSDSITETELGTTPGNKKVRIYERGSQFDILSRVPNTYMWVSPMPQDILRHNKLVQKRCSNSSVFSDFLIYHQSHNLTVYEQKFLQCLEQSVHRILSGLD